MGLKASDITTERTAPATDKQKAFMDSHGIAYQPGITKGEAWQRISDNKPKRGNKPARRHIIYPASATDPKRSHVRGYLTKQELEENIGRITERVREQLTEQFLRDAGKAYEALALARDDPDPKVRGEAVRAAMEHLNRVMGKVAEKQEHAGKIELIVKYDSPVVNDSSSDSPR